MTGPADPLSETTQPSPAKGKRAPAVSAEPARFDSIMRPIRAFRPSYVPVVMVYFAYGALGLIDVTRDLWIKESLSLTPVAACRHRRVADACRGP